MLPIEHRLRNQKSFDRVYARGRSFKTPLFIIRSVASETKRFRFAVVVSSKVSKKAVVRNRVRRRMQAILGSFMSEGVKAVDVIISMGPKAADAEFEALERELRKAFIKFNLFQ